MTPINLSAVIDERPLGRFQLRAVILCAIIALLDGFDTQAIAFVAPAIAADWGVESAQFGPVFGAGLLGLTIGALTLGPLADRFGRKLIVIASTVLFGGFALASASAATMSELILFRFLTGLGLGGAMPNLIALTSEYAPKRMRGLLVTVMFCGFPLGAVLGGLLSAQLISAFGWRSVFYAGGLAPLALLPFLVWLLPESVQFLISRDGAGPRVSRLASKLFRDLTFADDAVFQREDAGSSKISVLRLFTDGRAFGTMMLWTAFFMNLFILYLLINWLPTVLQEAGFPLENAILGTVLLNLGGIVGGVAIGRFLDQRSPFLVMTIAYVAAAIFVALLGQVSGSLAVTLAVVFVAGFCVIGAQFGANALSATFYPTSARSTGVGWAFGVGRVGSIVGPLTGGVLLSVSASTDVLFLVTAAPALVAALAIALMGGAAQRLRAAERALHAPALGE